MSNEPCKNCMHKYHLQELLNRTDQSIEAFISTLNWILVKKKQPYIISTCRKWFLTLLLLWAAINDVP